MISKIQSQIFNGFFYYSNAYSVHRDDINKFECFEQNVSCTSKSYVCIKSMIFTLVLCPHLKWLLAFSFFVPPLKNFPDWKHE